MKIALIKETKSPEDNRVALSPEQVLELMKKYPQCEFVVQSSNLRAFSDDEYAVRGIVVKDDVSDCDVLFGIKEPLIESLIAGKHYFFFGHFAKCQKYNKGLLQALIDKQISFSDYEYLVDDHGRRVCAFGWWAGVVGVYYSLQCYGLRYNLYNLPVPTKSFTMDELKKNLCSIALPPIKVLVTGNGRVSQGAQYILNYIGAKRLNASEYKSSVLNGMSYYVAGVEQLVENISGQVFDRDEFRIHPESFKSRFMDWAKYTDLLISCHFWDSNAPIYLDYDDYLDPDMKIKVIGDITCDINGSIKSTLRSSTHSSPFYDYNPYTRTEEKPFVSERNVSVMAVDTCPNALAIDTSQYFGSMLIDNVFEPILNNKLYADEVIRRATILRNGELTKPYLYLKEFSER